MLKKFITLSIAALIALTGGCSASHTTESTAAKTPEETKSDRANAPVQGEAADQNTVPKLRFQMGAYSSGISFFAHTGGIRNYRTRYQKSLCDCKYNEKRYA